MKAQSAAALEEQQSPQRQPLPERSLRFGADEAGAQPSMGGRGASEGPMPWLDSLAGWASFIIPFGIVLSRVSAGAQWRGDLAVVRALGMIPVGLEGVFSSLCAQLMGLLPLGGRHLRVALVSALALAVSGRIIYGLARRLLGGLGFSPRLTPMLSLAAALMASLSVTWQLEGTIAGGATVAAAFGLGSLLLRPARSTQDLRIWLGFGGMIALTATESPIAGGAIFVALLMQAILVGDLPRKRAIFFSISGFLSVAVVGLVPLLVRPFSERVGVHLGVAFRAPGIPGLDMEMRPSGALGAWQGDVGLVSLFIAAFGVAYGLSRRKTRWLAAPLFTLIVADAFLPALKASVVAADPLMPLRLMALGALAVFTALGVYAAVQFLSAAQIPLARPAASLLGLFTFALVLLTSERSAHVADRRDQLATEVWTDHALGRLPHGAVLLVRSPAVAWRLWAARVVRGERPDILLVPISMLNHGSVASQLLQREPALGTLLRDVAVNGFPGEYSLSSLADLRPLYVELEPGWSGRLVDHLVPEPLWLAFAPTAMGPSDRMAALGRAREAFDEVYQAAADPLLGRDEATLAMLATRNKEQLYALTSLNDKDAVASLVADLKRIDPEDPWALKLSKQLETHRRRRLDAAQLLR